MKRVTVDDRDQICQMIRNYIYDSEKIVVGVSGGIDSDVVARLCVKAVGHDRVHLFFVKQEGTPERRLGSARRLAEELKCGLSEIDLQEMNTELTEAIHAADSQNFNMESFMDYHRAKCSIRVAIFSAYQDNDFIFCSTTNRTELMTGACMPFGDMLGNIRPLIHLYKTQVYELAELVGTSEDILQQAPSADFWEGEDDMDDLSYMLLNEKQVAGYRRFNSKEIEAAQIIKKQLSGRKIDLALDAYQNNASLEQMSAISGLSIDICSRLLSLIREAQRTRSRKVLIGLEPLN